MITVERTVDVHEFKIEKKEPIQNDMEPLLIIRVKDSGGVSGALYGKNDCPIFVGRAFYDPMNKWMEIRIEMSSGE